MNKPTHRRKPALLETIRAVLWGFLGVRRKSDYEEDINKLNPLHLMAVGVVLAFLFVVVLIVLANWAVKLA